MVICTLPSNINIFNHQCDCVPSGQRASTHIRECCHKYLFFSLQKTMIEEQQKAINNLKRNLMDDMNERGVLSDPECQEIIDQHQQVRLHDSTAY